MFMKPAIINILAGMISLSGLVVMAGWLLDIPILASWIPGAITMKFITAISFVLSGAVLYFIGRAPRPGGDSVGDIVLTTASFTLALVMGTFLLSIAAGIHTGIEDIFVRDLTPAVHASVPGRPAVPTAIAFVLIAVSGLFWTARFKKRVVVIKVCGAIVGAIGGIAMLGYALDQPALYYAVEGVSNPIALSTATLFFMLGAGLLYAAGAQKKLS
ncbi:MAG: hypothetical protein HYW56_02100 [Candidatus Harrisonbacteria bacterium]|nr:hypothetical protein [Candidatus Harrisonbacteria bacterium]